MQNRKRDRCTEQIFGLCGRKWVWDVSREQHWNMYIIYGETDHQPRLDAWDKCVGLVNWEDPKELVGAGGGRGNRDGEYMEASFNFMAVVTICSDFGAQKIKSATDSPSICHEAAGPDPMILVFSILSFKLTFSLISFTFIIIFYIFMKSS